MLKKFLPLFFLLIGVKSFCYEFDQFFDDRLNGTSWHGVEYGFYASDKESSNSKYHKDLLCFDIEMSFYMDEVIWHDDEYGEWPIESVTFLKTIMVKSTNPKALKNWDKIQKKGMPVMVQKITDKKEIFELRKDTSIFAYNKNLKYRVKNDTLFIDLKLLNDTTIGLYDQSGNLEKKIIFCDNFANRINSKKRDADWTYWFEGDIFYLNFGDEKSILRCPYQRSKNGEAISLVLHKL